MIGQSGGSALSISLPHALLCHRSCAMMRFARSPSSSYQGLWGLV